MTRGIKPVSRAAYLGVPNDYYYCAPSDDADLPRAGRGFRVYGDAGTVRVINGAGRQVDISMESPGEFIGAVTRVLDTGTTATQILILV